MSENRILELFRQHRVSLDKYNYFMLAAAASAIAYALNRAEGRSLSPLLIPWVISLFLWGLSFFFGSHHVLMNIKLLRSNALFLQVQLGKSDLAGKHPEKIKIGSKKLREIIDKDAKKASRLGWLQIWLFITGVMAYTIWQLLDMLPVLTCTSP